MNWSKSSSPQSSTTRRSIGNRSLMSVSAATPTACQFLVVLGQFLDRENVVGGGAQDHVPLRPALKLEQQDQVCGSVDRARAPYHVGIAAPKLFIDEFRGQSFERRILDLAMPFRHVTADQKLDHPRIREQFLEGGVVHGWTGLGWNGLVVIAPRCLHPLPGVRGGYMVGWACFPETPCTTPSSSRSSPTAAWPRSSSATTHPSGPPRSTSRRSAQNPPNSSARMTLEGITAGPDFRRAWLD